MSAHTGFINAAGAVGAITAAMVYAGPVSGAAAAPTFRALVASDIPDLSSTYATAAVVSAQISALINGAPGLLDTLGEIAAQLATDESATAALVTTVNGKAAKAGDTFSGLVQFSGTGHAGLKLNNLTTTERDALVSSPAGALIWNTTTGRVNRYDGSAWNSGWTHLSGDTMTGALSFSGTGHAGLQINSLTTTQQNALTGAAGNLLWNSTLGAVTVYDGAAWQQQAVLGVAQTFTAAQTIKKDAIGSTSTDGFLLRNTTAAAAGAQQYSPRSVWEGQGWKTTATAASQAVAFMAEVRPVQGAANPTGTWALAASINGGAYSDVLTVASTGAVNSSLFSAAGFIASSYFATGNNTAVYLMGTSNDIQIARDAANTLGLRNAGTAGSPVPQAFNVYNFCATVATDAEWGYAKWVSNVFRIGTAAAVGTGSVRNFAIDVGGSAKWDYGVTTAATHTLSGDLVLATVGASVKATYHQFYVGGVASGYMQATANGVFAVLDNTGVSFNRLMFGGTSASFPAIKRNGATFDFRLADDSGYAGITVSSLVLNAALYFGGGGYGSILPGASGVLQFRDGTGTGFDRIQLGGTGTSHPAVVRNGVGVEIKLADSSAFTSIKGKLTTDNAYVATPQTCTGYVTLYDSSGTPYKVLVAA